MISSLLTSIPFLSPPGLYLYSPPGRGKTLLADLLIHPSVSRMHFIEFMQQTHLQLHRLRNETFVVPKSRRYEHVAKHLVKTPLLFLDELEVTDVADASILTELFNAIHAQGTTVVLTSNRAPEELYKGGLNWQQFQPEFAQKLRRMCAVVDMDGPTDFRTLTTLPASDPRTPLFQPHACADSMWAELAASLGEPVSEGMSIEVAKHLSRKIRIPLSIERSGVCRFAYSEICGPQAFLSGTCYLAIASTFEVVVIDNIDEVESKDDLRRLTQLVDVLYEHRRILVCAGGGGTFDDIFRERLIEDPPSSSSSGSGQIEVTDEGGSSGRLTTMVADGFEWSATGRVGASLVDLAAGDFSTAGFDRCRSRMGEMMRGDWLDKAAVSEQSRAAVRQVVLKQ